jgi:hypothetical protein
MVIFGGGGGNISFVPTMLNDTWVLSSADGRGGTPTWTQLTPIGGPPSGRGFHSAVYDPVSNSLIVFGGDLAIGFCGEETNDTWVLSNANGLGGTPVWKQLSPTGGPPSPRMEHSAVYDPATNRMIVFGGGRSCGPSFTNEVWVLENANGSGGTPNWVQLSPAGTPPNPRGSHTGVYDPSTNTMVIFGGFNQFTSTYVNDTWVLSNANGIGGTPTWTQLSPTGAPPAARAGHTATYNPTTNAMTVFAGTIPGGFLNDTWVLSNANGLAGTPTWTQLTPSGGPPGARAFHVAVLRTATNRMTMFAGDNGSASALNDVWVLKLLPVPFARFTGKLGATVSTGSFDLTSSFTLGVGSNGINPITEDVKLQIGPYTVTIPAGSFTNKQGAYVFQGVINGVSLQFTINPVGGNSYTLQAEGSGANLTGISNPVTVTLTIGDDAGSAPISAAIS